jgi:phosphoglycolate phosphatase-like HAD superfamily hydrolase
MKSAPRLLIFDIDGTLIRTGGAGRAAMNQAFLEVFGISDATGAIDLGGRTDLGIAREVLARAEHPWDRAKVERVFEDYLVRLAPAVAAAPGYEVMPGIHGLIERLSQDPEVALGLGTGNLEGGARIKLRRAGLDTPFHYGGFGSDAEDRTELIRIAATRGAAFTGLPLEECRPVVIGDTPRDIHAAQALNIPCVAVATGSYTLAQLEECAPAVVLTDLAGDDVPRILRDL